MTAPIRWGIIGTGRISTSLVSDLRAVDGMTVTGVWGRRGDRAHAFAAEHGIPFATDDLAAFLARDDIDIAYIATPIATHLPIALAALDAGSHVLVEKPMAHRAEAVAQIFARARERGLFAMEAMWMRFNPLHVEIQRRIREGQLGEPRSVRAGFGMPFPPGGTRWSSELGGSTVLDQGIYPVTLALQVLGEPTSVSAVGAVRDGVDVAAHITLEFDGGRFAHVACSIIEFVEPSASMSGTKGWAELDAMFWAGTTGSWRAGSTEALFHRPERLVFERQGNGYAPMLAAVRDALVDGELQHPSHDQRSTLAVARVLDDIRTRLGATLLPG